MAKLNPRYECKGCGGKPTRNQLKTSNGICIYCKTPMHHTSWLGGHAGNVFQLIRLSKGDEAELLEIAENLHVNVPDLIRAAIQKSLSAWENSPDKNTAAKADMILGKLSQR